MKIMLNFFITSPGVNNTQLDKSSHNSQNEKSLVAKVDLIQFDRCFVYSPAVSEKEYFTPLDFICRCRSGCDSEGFRIGV